MAIQELLSEIEDNFRFLIIEVSKQLEDALYSLDNPADSLLERVMLRDDHIDNLKGIIEKKVYLGMIPASSDSKRLMDFAKSIIIITANLERIGDFCVNIVNQIQYFNDPSFIKNYDCKAFFDEINTVFSIIPDAVFRNDMFLAIDICHSEYSLDILYKTNFEAILKELHEHREIQNLLTTLFILRYLERIGDSLLNIGEAIISSIIGEKLKIHQIHALGESLESTEYDYPDPDFSFESIGETKSGCKIGIVQLSDREGDKREIIFKEGKRYKIEKEYHNILKWKELSPGTPPEVHGLHIHSLNASLLLEKLEGLTFQEILLKKDFSHLKKAINLLISHCRSLWSRTKSPGNPGSSLFSQLNRRMDDILKVHPDFDSPERHIGHLKEPSFKELLRHAMQAEKSITVPFTVFIHGDFNIDNIICNISDKKIHYVDLHRSAQSDYIQDSAVFLVSNYRVPRFDKRFRRKIDYTARSFFEFTRSFALENNDETFNYRMTLGIIRSLLTSTRFHLNDEFARSMYHRALYLLSRLYDFRGDPKHFSFPESVLYY